VKRRAAVLAVAVVAVGLSSGAALAAGSPASPKASCVATITSFEASQLEPGAVGEEVSALTTLAPGFVGGLVSDLAHAHAASIEACFEAEG
jgi:hypothetical protein